MPRLHEAERRLYDDLRWRRLRDAPIRLEQERIGFGWVARALTAALALAHGPDPAAGLSAPR